MRPNWRVRCVPLKCATLIALPCGATSIGLASYTKRQNGADLRRHGLCSPMRMRFGSASSISIGAALSLVALSAGACGSDPVGASSGSAGTTAGGGSAGVAQGGHSSAGTTQGGNANAGTVGVGGASGASGASGGHYQGTGGIYEICLVCGGRGGFGAGTHAAGGGSGGASGGTAAGAAGSGGTGDAGSCQRYPLGDSNCASASKPPLSYSCSGTTTPGAGCQLDYAGQTVARYCCAQ